MENSNAKKGKTYPGELFAVMGTNGEVKLYTADPLRAKDRESVQVSLDELLVQNFGSGTIVNPLVLKLAGLVMQRGEAFSISLVENIRKGIADKHIEDLEGNVVEILMRRNNDESYPMSGIPIAENGDILAARTYSPDGVCSDGVEQHNLIIIDGPAVPEK